MAKQDHTVLLLGGAGAAVAAYEWLYKPWKAEKDAAALAATSGNFTPLPVAPTPSYVSSPTPVYPVTGPTSPSIPNVLPASPNGGTGSIVDPRITPGGDVGQAMWRKGWTQQVASDRLNAIKTGYAQQKAEVARQQANGGAASGVAEAQAQLARTDAAIALQSGVYNQLVAAGNDPAGVAAYGASLNGLRADRADLSNRIAAAQAAGQSSNVNAYLSSMAALNADYNALTGYSLG